MTCAFQMSDGSVSESYCCLTSMIPGGVPCSPTPDQFSKECDRYKFAMHEAHRVPSTSSN